MNVPAVATILDACVGAQAPSVTIKSAPVGWTFSLGRASAGTTRSSAATRSTVPAGAPALIRAEHTGDVTGTAIGVVDIEVKRANDAGKHAMARVTFELNGSSAQCDANANPISCDGLLASP